MWFSLSEQLSKRKIEILNLTVSFEKYIGFMEYFISVITDKSNHIKSQYDIT